MTMTGVINYLREKGGTTEGVYICTDWYDNELSYYLGFWPKDRDRIEESIRGEVQEWLQNNTSYEEGEISISGMYENGKFFTEEWSAHEIQNTEKVLDRIMELVKMCSDPETLPWTKIKEAKEQISRAKAKGGTGTGAVMLFGMTAWYSYDGLAEKRWDLQYMFEV
tara:strand:+ start:1745 stop:2242 length:498 start_codon:yes stop_codon:yes gene_type:complete